MGQPETSEAQVPTTSESRAGTGAGVRRVARNSLAPFAANLAGRVLAWGMAVVMARRLGPAGTGAYALVVNMWLYASIVADFGLGTWLTREIAQAPHLARRAVAETLGIRLALSCLSAPLLVGVAALYAWYGADPQIVPTAALLALGLLPGALSAAGTALFNAHEEMTLPAGLQLVSAGLTTVAGAAVLFAGQGIVALGWVSLTVNLLIALAFYAASRRRFFAPGVAIDAGRQARILKDSLPLLLNSLLNNVFFRADVQVLQSQGSATVGYYTNAYKVLDAAGAVPSSFVLALFPVMSRGAARAGDGGRASLARVYRLALKLLVAVALPVAILVAFGADDLTRWFWGTTFLPDSAVALRILIWFLPLSFFNGLTQYVLISLGLQRSITPAFALTAAFNLGANLLLIPMFSYRAAAAITVASEVVLLAPFLLAVRSALPVRPVLTAAIHPAAPALVAAAMLLVIADWSRLVGVVMFALAYPPLLLVFRVFSKSERDVLGGLLPASLARYAPWMRRAAR